MDAKRLLGSELKTVGILNSPFPPYRLEPKLIKGNGKIPFDFHILSVRLPLYKKRFPNT